MGQTFPPTQLTLDWYRDFFADDEFTSALWVSLKLAVIVTVLSVVLGWPPSAWTGCGPGSPVRHVA